MNIHALTVSLLLLTSATAGLVTGQEDSEDPQHARIQSELGDSWFDIWINPENSTVRIFGHIPSSQDEQAFLKVKVDETTIYRSRIRSTSDKVWKNTFDFSRRLDVFREEHEITVSTYGDHETFLVERDIDASKTTSVPAPRITGVEVGRVVHRGKMVAAVNVTVHNPSIQPYLSRLMVHTTQTTGAIEPRGFQPESTMNVTIPLHEPPGDVSGEVRLYGGRANDREDALAQVEFSGAPDGTTTFRNESYVPVPEPHAGRAGGEYRYRESSNREPTLSDRIQTDRTHQAALAGSVLTALVGALWWRR